MICTLAVVVAIGVPSANATQVTQKEEVRHDDVSEMPPKPQDESTREDAAETSAPIAPDEEKIEPRRKHKSQGSTHPEDDTATKKPPAPSSSDADTTGDDVMSFDDALWVAGASAGGIVAGGVGGAVLGTAALYAIWLVVRGSVAFTTSPLLLFVPLFVVASGLVGAAIPPFFFEGGTVLQSLGAAVGGGAGAMVGAVAVAALAFGGVASVASGGLEVLALMVGAIVVGGAVGLGAGAIGGAAGGSLLGWKLSLPPADVDQE